MARLSVNESPKIGGYGHQIVKRRKFATGPKGGVENANGRLRRWLLRSLDLDTVSEADIQDVVVSINTTPRKCLGFITPLQAMLKELGKDVQIRFA
ncbi:MAG: hypothetical protein KAG89_02155 [Fulvimarina manganoxydans]|uniref:hypothetical protein n=1 Tax=Fulvimarina manganoxydans TaxID=937218 RepID=UPI00235533D3|nr:hypothetical protein [Fulvimarina manganoxydans]MCK5930948.1 hypothetical protein [Fulvimarina manganoxydans]